MYAFIWFVTSYVFCLACSLWRYGCDYEPCYCRDISDIHDLLAELLLLELSFVPFLLPLFSPFFYRLSTTPSIPWTICSVVISAAFLVFLSPPPCAPLVRHMSPVSPSPPMILLLFFQSSSDILQSLSMWRLFLIQ